jgi:SNF family Na+-dependent transporter
MSQELLLEFWGLPCMLAEFVQRHLHATTESTHEKNLEQLYYSATAKHWMQFSVLTRAWIYLYYKTWLLKSLLFQFLSVDLTRELSDRKGCPDHLLGYGRFPFNL